ncbi:MAG TPA: patatin-like phospholipase family protein, partial [Acidimicrobiales bacterium]|nr:patatin-like phospholipase family protein [Acidimicrobiales bacterium]
APISLHVVATDLCRVEVVVLRSGDVMTALLASAAIPGLFPPVEIEGRTLVDGGVLANVPIAEAELLEPSVVYVLPATVDRTFCDPSNAIVMLQRAVSMSGLPQQRRALQEAAARREVHVLPVPEAAATLSIFDFKETDRLIDDAYQLAAAAIGGRGREKE